VAFRSPYVVASVHGHIMQTRVFFFALHFRFMDIAGNSSTLPTTKLRPALLSTGLILPETYINWILFLLNCPKRTPCLPRRLIATNALKSTLNTYLFFQSPTRTPANKGIRSLAQASRSLGHPCANGPSAKHAKYKANCNRMGDMSPENSIILATNSSELAMIEAGRQRGNDALQDFENAWIKAESFYSE